MSEILNVSDVVYSNKGIVQIPEQLSTEVYSQHCQTFKMERFATRIVSECRRAARSFQGGGDFMEKFS